jgi:phospholipid transport system transporter-binding protein
MNGLRLTARGSDRYALQGELTFATVAQALKVTAPLFTGRSSLRFDLDGIGRVDSAGVALLIEWVRRAREAGIRLLFAHLPARLWAIIRVGGVEKLLPVEGARTDAQPIKR